MNLYEELKCVNNIFLSTSMLLSAEINGSILKHKNTATQNNKLERNGLDRNYSLVVGT